MGRRKYILSVLILLFSFTLTAQTDLEKIYTQTDRPFYFPGETMWFKTHVVRGDNTISTINDVLEAQLLAPNGSVVKKIKLSVRLGYAYGDFYIDKDWIGGRYKLKIYTNWTRNYGEKAYFTKDIVVQKVVKPNALLKLDFDKEGYGKGVSVTANFEAKDLKNNPFSEKSFLYRVSIKGKKISEKSLKTNTKGEAKIIFKLPTDLSTRDVVLNVLVSSKGTTESISRSVPITLDNIDLQFFAESGKLLQGTSNKVGFKALDEFAKPVAVEGVVVDESGVEVSKFKSFHDGMGAFNFSPIASKKYFALVKVPFVSSVKVPLPKVHNTGVHFGVISKGKNIKINLFSTLDKKLRLKIANSYNTLLEQEISKNQKLINLNSSRLPMGITKFTIIDERNIPLAERLVFVNPHKQLKVSIDLDKEEYQTREKVTVSLTTTDENNKPVSANLAVAVVDNKILSFADDKQDHILSGLLLSSELKGKIYKPSFYFNSKKKKSYEAIDYLMLTHGWRDYITNPITIDSAKFKPNKLNIQTGVVLDKKDKPVKAKLILFNNQYKSEKLHEFETDEKGRFAFRYKDNANLVLVAYRDDKKRVHIVAKNIIDKLAINTNRRSIPYIKNRRKRKSARKSSVRAKLKRVINKDVKESKIASSENSNSRRDVISMKTNGNSLSAVVVTGYSASEKEELACSYSVIKSEDIMSVSSTDAVQALSGKVSGVRINQGFFGSNISIRGSSSISGGNEPLIVMDGVPIEKGDINNVDSDNISSLTVLKNANATALYGCRGANGVIVITTNGYSSNTGKNKFKKKRYKNYDVVSFGFSGAKTNLYSGRRFYVPKYNDEYEKEILRFQNDFRQTIYWNPLVLTDAKGKAKVSFYNSDATTSFKVTSEGIASNGLVGRQEKDYATKKPFSVDFKMPNYMAINDTINIPVTYTNSTNKDIKIKSYFIGFEYIADLKEGDLENTIKANSSFVKYFTVIPKNKIDNQEIWLRVYSDNKDVDERIVKKITILSPYFPIQVAISGTKSKAYSFRLKDVVKGSIKSNFNVYTDIVGDVMDGIEGILRSPSGCFEQVSSSTYPNILVLKYLKETNKSNPKIERKAMDYIKKGYKKLAGYETSENGFEWYGASPPHEALSAYGLMEFTEMKEVYAGVDEKMLQRTITYLLSRRNGNGGFKQNRGKYGFSAAPEDVNNAYIVYAISESKIKADIEKEYTSTLKEALNSEDTYRMALLACASYNFNKMENYKLLMAKINKHITEKGFVELPVENTITRSYGKAKNIETTAFTLLAMLKNNNTDMLKVAKGIEYLVSQRKNGRFGSTQSTSMALKALIEYTRVHKNEVLGNAILSINKTEIKQDLTKKYRIGENVPFKNLGSYFKSGKQVVAVKYENSKVNFPYSLNITYDSYVPESSGKSPLLLNLDIPKKIYKVGDNVSLQVSVSNKTKNNLGMVTAIIGFPSGTTPQPWQLKKLVDEKQVAYYEIFDNYLVFYWREFGVKENKNIRLDLKADVSGSYQAPASAAYLYYGDEFKTWVKGNTLKIAK